LRRSTASARLSSASPPNGARDAVELDFEPFVEHDARALVGLAEGMIQTELVGRRHEDRERYYEQLDIDTTVAELGVRLARGEPDSIEAALAFLERDPYFFRSGYARERVARRLARLELTVADKTRARALVLSTVDGHRHCPQPGIGRLARAAADNRLRRELRVRLHHLDAAVARRALRMVVSVRHPGLTDEDIGAARTIVLADASRGDWLSPTVRRLAMYLWSSEWETELRNLIPYHGPHRAAAKRLIEAADQRRWRRPGP
jgi:hypothetical protein